MNESGKWYRGFGPELVANLFTYLPDLEELIFDQTGAQTFCPLPGTLVRIIVCATMRIIH